METTNTVDHNVYQDVSSSTLINNRLAEQQGAFPTNNATKKYSDHPNLLELPHYGLEELGLRNLGHVYRNLPVPTLVEHSIARAEGILASNGALCVKTGKYTGRSPGFGLMFKDGIYIFLMVMSVLILTINMVCESSQNEPLKVYLLNNCLFVLPLNNSKPITPILP